MSWSPVASLSVTLLMPVLKSLGKSEVFGAWTTNPYTRSFRHMLGYNRHWDRRYTFRDPKVKSAKTKDRVKFWNIVPGDQVRVKTEADRNIYEVLSINRLSNFVRLKVPSTSEKVGGKKIQYSNLQLLVGHHEFPLKDGNSEPEPVFATRLSTSKPKFNPLFKRWDWQRFAVNTVPKLPSWTGDRRDRVTVPWPTPIPREVGDAGLYDTPKDVVAEITYTPPSLPVSTKQPLPRAPSEHEYITYLTSPNKSSFKPSQPMELNLVKEVSNPHSRAKKQRRWQEKQEYERALLLQFIREELKDLKGRTSREARAEATFKCRQKLDDDRKAELRRRWEARGQEAKLVRKRARKARKEIKKSERLTNLVLQQGNNQILPPDARA